MATDISQYKSVKEVLKDDVFSASKDGNTVVLRDGTKVSDELIAQAKKEAAAREAGKAAAAGAEGVSDADLNARIDAAVAKALSKK